MNMFVKNLKTGQIMHTGRLIFMYKVYTYIKIKRLNYIDISEEHKYRLTLKAPIKTAADDSLQYFFIFFQTK